MKKKGFLTGDPPPEDEDSLPLEENSVEELDEKFDYHNPICTRCGRYDYTACNVNEESGDVVSCDKCPVTSWLH